MITKFKSLGTLLSGEQMKHIQGGVAWEQLRDFKCRMQNNTILPGGCENVSGGAAATCICLYGSGFSSVEWGAWGCPYRTGC